MKSLAIIYSPFFVVFFLVFLAIPAFGTTYYVDANSTNPTPPYTDWSIAATNIQDAVNLTLSGDTVLVTNGVYQYGGIVLGGETNRVFVTNAITLASVGGSQATTIVGGLSTRCVAFVNNAALVGFTITGANGNIGQPGPQIAGGVYCGIGSVVSNCFIVNNTAGTGGGIYGTGAVYNSVISGNIDSKGAVAYASLYNCMVFSNSANIEGGGLYFATASNCFIADNQANVPISLGGMGGGGVYHSTLYNSTISGNQGTRGGGAYQSQLYNCSILTNSGSEGGGAFLSVLTNCLVSGNVGDGGGVYDGSSYNCIFSGNSSPGNGGAGHNAAFYGCLLVSNFAANDGGGGANCAIYNCTVVDNVAGGSGGGVEGGFGGAITNSIIYYNSAPTGSNWYNGAFQSSCSTPAASGFITNEPAFVNMASGDFHLQSNSPCINAGNNSYVPTATDLDGNPRIKGGTVDIGAYEYQTPTSVISYAYLQQYGLPTDGSVDSLDLDGTGFTVYQDWITGLNPTNPASVLAIFPPAATNNTAGITVTWQSVSGILYNLQRTTNLPTPFSTIQSNIVGNAGTTTYNDTSATNGTPYFYRVGVP